MSRTNEALSCGTIDDLLAIDELNVVPAPW